MMLTKHHSLRLNKEQRERLRTAPKSARELARLALRWMLRMTPLIAIAAGPAVPQGRADEAEGESNGAAHADKSGYSLFSPTPEKFMRELSADRPDKTDSPFTVDAGHFQLEMDFANLTVDLPNSERRGLRSTAVQAAPMNLKVGLLNNVDFQLVFTPGEWEQTRDRDTNLTTRQAGFDGITPRLKINLVGNDGGFFALGLIPFVKLPWSSGHLDNGFVEGGLGIPWSLDIPGWDVGLQTTVHVNHDDFGNRYHTEYDNSISIGHALVGKLSGSVEFFSNVSTERGAGWIGTVDTWLTYQASRNVRFDAGVYIGVTPAADDWHPWIGMTWRF